MGEYNFFNRPVYPDDIQIRRTWDLENIKNVAHKRALYNANNELEKELEACWVSEPKNMATASFGRNWGYYVGMDEIKRYYLDKARRDSILSGAQPMSSWAIEEAEDGKTAQGIWYSMSYLTYDKGNGPEAYWFGEKIGIDFIKEGESWKIWHLFMGCDWFNAPGDDISEQPSTIENDPNWVNPLKAEFGEPTIKMVAYDNKYNWSHYPPLPTPHKTWTDTVSCGPEGNPNYKAKGGN
jgi:hypothetical protein